MSKFKSKSKISHQEQEKEQQQQQQQHQQQQQQRQQDSKLKQNSKKKLKVDVNGKVESRSVNESNEKKCPIKDKYFQCYAKTPIYALIKLIRNKYNIPIDYDIRLTHMGHRLEENETLIEIYTCFILNKNDTLDIEFELKRNKSKSLINITNSTNENLNNLNQNQFKNDDISYKIDSHTNNCENKSIQENINESKENINKDESIINQSVETTLIKKDEISIDTSLNSTTSCESSNLNQIVKAKKVDSNLLKVKFRTRPTQNSYRKISPKNSKTSEDSADISQVKEEAKVLPTTNKNDEIDLPKTTQLYKESEIDEKILSEKSFNLNNNEVNCMNELKDSATTQVSALTIQNLTISIEQHKIPENKESDSKKDNDQNSDSDSSSPRLLIVDENNNDNNNSNLSTSFYSFTESTSKLNEVVNTEHNSAPLLNSKEYYNDESVNLNNSYSSETPLDLTIQKK